MVGEFFSLFYLLIASPQLNVFLSNAPSVHNTMSRYIRGSVSHQRIKCTVKGDEEDGVEERAENERTRVVISLCSLFSVMCGVDACGWGLGVGNLFASHYFRLFCAT